MTPQAQAGKLDRRAFLKRGVLAGGALAAGGITAAELLEHGGHKAIGTRALPGPRGGAGQISPNVLVIVVDQMRSVFGTRGSERLLRGLVPNIEALSRESVQFVNHYTASNDCSPARSTLLTGLYTHQTGCMITGGSTLDPGFPTWGSLMREHGYRTWWFGKWHLTHGDGKWTLPRDAGALEPYGFSGGTYPSPNGAPGQGSRVDPSIADQFEHWLKRHWGDEPWCTTVSFVNPHDIAWWYRWTDRISVEREAPRRFHALPANFETPSHLRAQRKPRLQHSLQDTSAASFGPVPFAGGDVLPAWMPFLDLYAKLQRRVDAQVGRVLRALSSRPKVAANTVVLFTSDHGEYGAAHGLRGKGAAVYEEGIRVPLLVKDPREPAGKTFTTALGVRRRQLTSSVDIVALLLTIAAGSDAWRAEPRYAHLAGRLDLVRILADPAAPGREQVLHATDEIVTEFALETYAADAPLHVIGLRAVEGKYAIYSRWRQGTMEPLLAGEEVECYDYDTVAGRLELENVAKRSPLEDKLRARLERAFRAELRASLPRHLEGAARRGLNDYLHMAKRDAEDATRHRRRKAEREGLGPARASA